MDYSVGSISDLITGANTPNKPKIIKTDFKEVVDFGKYGHDLSLEINQKHKKLKKHKTSVQGEELEGNDGTTLVKNEKKKKIKNEQKQNSVIRKESKQVKKQNIASDIAEEVTGFAEDNRVEKRQRAKILRANQKENKKDETRTVYVGNVPLTTKADHLKRFFMKFGAVESVRFRGVPVKDAKTSKKVAAIRGEFHPDRKSWIAYVKFESVDDAKTALEANGSVYENHHIRVSLCNDKEQFDDNKGIFIGNLSLKAEEEQLWKLFQPCGKILNVRIVRDKKTGMGKGFAFVNFSSSDSVQLALELEDVSLDGRVLRITQCNSNAPKKNKPKQKKLPGVPKPKKFQPYNGKQVGTEDGESTSIDVLEQKSKKKEKRKRANTDASNADEKSQNGPILDSSVDVQDQSFQGEKTKEKKSKKKEKRKHADTDASTANEKSHNGSILDSSVDVQDQSFQGEKLKDKKKKKKNKELQRKKRLSEKIL